MKPPTCKLCETRHWLDEPHDTSALRGVRELGASVLRNTVTKPPNNVTTVTKRTPVTKPVLSDVDEAALAARPMPNTAAHRSTSPPSLSAGRPKKHKTNAERQRAYRGRRG